MLYIRLSLPLRNIENLPHARGIEVSQETACFWWHCFGPTLAAEIRNIVRASVTSRFSPERSLTSRTNFRLNRAAVLAEGRGLCTA